MSERPHISRYGDDGTQKAEIRAVWGINTSLSLILLTLLVYLVSLTNVDEARRSSVYASLAKAFMFTERSEQAAPVETGGALLSGSRQGLRALMGYLGDDPSRGEVAWEGPNLIVNLPDAPDGAVPAELLARVGTLAGAMDQLVRVEAYAAPGDTPADPFSGSLGRAVAVAHTLLALGTGLDERRVEAVGHSTPLPLADGLGAETPRVRVVIRNAEGTL
ncbi:MAG: hypothetical protein HZA24_03710 [Nitrospirae bacterium]|nr:hypothetical protein [Nitrospirota bacterium]